MFVKCDTDKSSVWQTNLRAKSLRQRVWLWMFYTNNDRVLSYLRWQFHIWVLRGFCRSILGHCCSRHLLSASSQTRWHRPNHKSPEDPSTQHCNQCRRHKDGLRKQGVDDGGKHAAPCLNTKINLCFVCFQQRTWPSDGTKGHELPAVRAHDNLRAGKNLL